MLCRLYIDDMQHELNKLAEQWGVSVADLGWLERLINKTIQDNNGGMKFGDLLTRVILAYFEEGRGEEMHRISVLAKLSISEIIELVAMHSNTLGVCKYHHYFSDPNPTAREKLFIYTK